MSQTEEATYIIQELMTTEVTDQLSNTCNTITTSVSDTNVHNIQIHPDDSVNHGGSRSEVWTTEQTEKLITVVKENYNQITENNLRKGPFFKCITKFLLPLMPSITPKQVENKWKNLTYRFNRYEDNRINNLGMKLKQPSGYELLKSFLELWGQEQGQTIKTEPSSWKDDSNAPDIIISGPPDYLSSNSDDSDIGEDIKSNSFNNNKGNILPPRHFMDEEAILQTTSEFNITLDEGDSKSPLTWSDEATIAFIKLVKANFKKVNEAGSRKHAIFQEIATALQPMIPSLSWRQVHNKWKNTKSRFYYYQEQSHKDGFVRKKTPVGYEILCTFLKSGGHTFRNGTTAKWDDGDDVDAETDEMLPNSFTEDDADMYPNSNVKKIKLSDDSEPPVTITLPSSIGNDSNDDGASSFAYKTEFNAHETVSADGETHKSLVWSREATLRLLKLLKDNFSLYLERAHKRTPIFAKMAEIISSNNPAVSPQQVETKLKNLRAAYIRYERGKLSGQRLKKPVGYNILYSLFGEQVVSPEAEPQNNYDPGSPINSIDISEFLTIPIQSSTDVKVTNEEVSPMKGASAANVRKLISTVETNSKRIEKKLDELISGQERIAIALEEKNNLLRKILGNEDEDDKVS